MVAVDNPPSPVESTQREKMTEYWNQDHSAPTLENMMLDADAGKMDVLERPEILSELPSLAGKRVLELGAGIGRFTGMLAAKAAHVVALDFVESSCAENRRVHADLNNIEVVCDDATRIAYPPQSFDVVFSNWLLMYLNDEEVKDLARKSLEMLKPGGVLFFRESCFHQSGNVKRRFNPTQYRHPDAYSDMFSQAVLEDGSCFTLQATNCVEAYAQLKGNVHQMWFRWVKVDSCVSQRAISLLRGGQYSLPNLLRYEAVYGKDYIGPGGDELSKRLADSCNLKPGSRVLDLGSGLGGTSWYIAEQFPGTYVHGVSFLNNINAVTMGRHVRRESDLRNRVSFDTVDEFGIPAEALAYPPNSFDAMVCREALLHVAEMDKPVLLRKLSRLLRRGGRFALVEMCNCKPLADCGKEFQEYVESRGYAPLAVAAMQELLGRYFKVEMVNVTEDFERFFKESWANVESHFGPGAQQSLLEPKDDEELMSRLTEAMQKTMPGFSELALASASKAALETLKLHRETERAENERRAADYKWCEENWRLKREVLAAGDVAWYMFVVTKV